MIGSSILEAWGIKPIEPKTEPAPEPEPDDKDDEQADDKGDDVEVSDGAG